ncbi:MAG: TetR/AcrR family transcriptional regulator [Clostridia bacterium]|nr:TetR/AcrR family transcriptional regulator [Clostridia bacterium]
MPRKNVPDARNRILQTAVKIFAEKSFEGSRIEEIAREANVPKSLIYYHFKSKEEILEVLTKNFIEEYTNLIKVAESDTHQSKAEKLPERMSNVYYEFGQRNADLVRVMFIDSLKKSKEIPVLFKVVEALIEAEKKFHVGKSKQEYDVHERLMAEFFTSFMPNYAYVCFADSWTKYFNIDRERFDQLYMKIFMETHGEYHRKHE